MEKKPSARFHLTFPFSIFQPVPSPLPCRETEDQAAEPGAVMLARSGRASSALVLLGQSGVWGECNSKLFYG